MNKTMMPRSGCRLCALALLAAGSLWVGAAQKSSGAGYMAAYYMDGRIYVNELGTPEGKPLLVPPVRGQEDFKPSWSKTGDMLVFFRRVKNDPVVTNWKTVVCVIRVDGTGFRRLTDGAHTDFNPTWTRDGSNTPIWNRKNPKTGGFCVMASKADNRPGQEVTLSDPRYHTWAHTCLKDGRILVESAHPTQGWGYFLMTPKVGGGGRYERIDCGGLARQGLLCRISLSPSGTKVCFEHQIGHKFREWGHAIYIADFDVNKRAITNPRVIANKARSSGWFAYPRWTPDEAAVVYHANTAGKGALFLYSLKDGSTRRVSTNPAADYRYPHCEATPK
ncbi:MAG: PD40 domain-containing protein [Verrucomicrobia bacterium]|nr:PD40 domain-containing protein [Verrucomicrobiota bacterium]